VIFSRRQLIGWGMSLLLLAIYPLTGWGDENQADAAAIGLQPLVLAPDLFPILPWDVLHDWKEPHRNPRA